MDIDTKRPQRNELGSIIDVFVKVGEETSLCTEFRPRNQESKFENIFVLF